MNSAAIDVATHLDGSGAPWGDADSHRFVAVPRLSSGASAWRRALSFAGPGFLVAVGYMDPGNWATSLGAGSAFGYSLLSVVLLSNGMAMLLQAASVRLGVASGLDLAQSCRRNFPPSLNFVLWLGCEMAVIACNLAEVLGMACGLALLFHIPLPIGVCITVADVFLVLGLQRKGVRVFESLIIALIVLIGACFAVQIWWLHPSATAVAAGFVPTTQLLSSPQMLYLAVGIIGATVMPHNLYLHSSIVKTRQHERCEAGLRQAIRYATIDSNVALTFALFVNVGIMVLAAGAFHRTGQAPVATLEEAHRLLSPLLGVSAASTVFGVALIASGLSSSVTGTLAGQVVMEGFLDIRTSPVLRAVVTRCLAIGPALIIAVTSGSAGVGRLLVFSQVILGLQLPFAVVPLLWFTTRREHLGVHAFKRIASIALWSVATALIMINLWVLYELTAPAKLGL